MTAHKIIKKLTANAKNEFRSKSSQKRPAMELQINRAIKKENNSVITTSNITGVNSNF